VNESEVRFEIRPVFDEVMCRVLRGLVFGPPYAYEADSTLCHVARSSNSELLQRLYHDDCTYKDY